MRCEQSVRATRRPFPKSLIFLCVLSASGCGVADKFDQAIKEVHDLRISIEKQSANWQSTIKNTQLQLTSDVKQIINKDLRDAMDKSIAELGIEARCEIDFVNNNLKSWLLGVETSIKNKKKEFYDSPVKATLSPETMISDAIKSAPPIEPKVCHVIPTIVTFGMPDKKPDRESAEFVGYALTELSGSPVSLIVHGTDRPTEGFPIPNPTSILVQSTTYKTALPSTQYAQHLLRTDKKLALKYGKTTVAELGLAFVDPPPPAPIPKITSVQINFETTEDDKDREIEFTLAVNRPDGPGKPVVNLGVAMVGNNEVWPNKDRRTVTIPLDPAWPYDNRSVLNLYIGYDSHNRGNPGWEGKLNVVAIRDIGEAIEVVSDTGNFKLGESGNPHSRSFPFNK